VGAEDGREQPATERWWRASAARLPQPAVRKASGRLDRLVDGLVAAMYRRKTYREPRAWQAARLARAYTAVRAGKLRRAALLSASLGYEVVRFRDTGSRRSVVLLAERVPRRRGWGLYVHSPGSRSALVVEVAHPGADIKTERVGVEVFRHAHASDLFVAGAHRYAAADESSDVAHNSRSAYEAVHRARLQDRPTVLQPHGFDSGERGRQFGEIVISSGDAPTAPVRSVAQDLRAAGFKTCLYEPGHCEGLGATTNVQGQSARAAGAVFVHLELALRLRETRALRARVVSILADRLG
jgi:hypothetical protein